MSLTQRRLKAEPRESLKGFPLSGPAVASCIAFTPSMHCGLDPQLDPLQCGIVRWEHSSEKSPSCRTMSMGAAVFKPRANPSGSGCWSLGSPPSTSLSTPQFPRHSSCSIVPSCLGPALPLPLCPHPKHLADASGEFAKGQHPLCPHPLQTTTPSHISWGLSSCKLLLLLCKQPWPLSRTWYIQYWLLPSFAWALGTNKGSPEAEAEC